MFSPTLTIMLSMIALAAFCIVDAKTAVSGFAKTGKMMIIAIMILSAILSAIRKLLRIKFVGFYKLYA